VFISHAWKHKDEYKRLVDLLNGDSSFAWEDLSVPKEKPLSVFAAQLPKSNRSLVRQLDERILRADCLLVPAGMYVAHSEWMQSEIEAAGDFGKPIIAVEPRGSERLPKAATHSADETVGWNGASIISTIRRCVDGPATLLGLQRVLPPPRR
jgi:hypothetical protein